jgi:hypothetical protein
VDHHSDGIYIDEAYFTRQKFNKIGCTQKAKPLYEKNNFQSSGQHLFCRGKKEF